MIQPSDDRRPAMTPQLAVRVAVVGTIALAMFAIIFFRLWFLQVLSTTQYAHAATQNQTRTVDVPAPRGEVTDRFGNALVRSQLGFDVKINAPALPVPVTLANVAHPPHPDYLVYRKLAAVLGMSMHRQKCTIASAVAPVHPITVRLAPISCTIAKGLQQLPYASVTVAPGVSTYVQTYLDERQTEFRGVTVQPVYQRTYLDGSLAAQVLGTVGPITPEVLGVSGPTVTRREIAHSRFKGLPESAQVGQSGLEYAYDSALRGIDGQQKVEVNAFGQFEGYGTPKQPVPGDTLKTTLDSKLQQVGEQALQQSINTNPPADGGAFVAMNPQDGEIYAMGSNPTYNPSVFTKPVSTAEFQQLFGPNANDPQQNRAYQSAGATGSAFKMITATAALQSGAWGVSSSYDDTGQFCFTGSTLCLHNSGHAAYGVVDMVKALEVSDDVFFYHLGALLNADPAKYPNGGALQQWAHKYGIGRKTGIDLPGEDPGTLPSPRQQADSYYHEEVPCEKATGAYAGHPKHPASQGGCGIAANPYWTIGDNVNAAVGQGDDQVTPLQLAVAYGAMANGGAVVTPHVGDEIESPNGTVLTRIAPPAKRHLSINPTYRQTIMQGLRDAASQPGGTSYDVMGSFGEPVYGKTGTAQYIVNGAEQDYAWYACFVPASATTRPIVVVVTVEKGGFGDVGAAPVARELLSQWFFGKSGGYHAGTSTTL
ncbi:MAG TPA: penicillin-binding transpeptidase domain-containing protein [Solirubrobacteraceae bacterium]|nr:penicillin-binding transpeptidase domain-containing protein [Solirubrobacteraceae bacterium]